MYLSELIASCRRRWLLLLVLLTASGGLCVIAVGAIPPSYEAGAKFVLVPPVRADDPLGNRFLDLGSLGNSVDVLARSMTSVDTAEMLEATAPEAEYDVSHDPTTSAPIVLISVTSGGSSSTTKMLDAVMEQLPRTLEQLQNEIDVKTESRITTIVLAVDTTEASNRSRVRLLVALGLALLFASAITTAVIDGLLLRRSRRDTARRREPRPGVPPQSVSKSSQKRASPAADGVTVEKRLRTSAKSAEKSRGIDASTH